MLVGDCYNMNTETSSFRARKALHASGAAKSASITSQRKRKGKKDTMLRIVFVVVASLIFMPILYLQHQFLTVSDHGLRDVRHGKMDQIIRSQKIGSKPTILTAYLESPSSVSYSPDSTTPGPLFARNASALTLRKVEFPRVRGCDPNSRLPDLPIDDFPVEDPFLPWLHDYFVSEDARYIRFVGQNKRRCNTGKEHIDTMSFWEPQVTLFQSIPVVEEASNDTNKHHQHRYRLASSMEEATHPATRFQCRFFDPGTQHTITTLSEFKFDYEYVTWRKSRRPMIDKRGGKDTAMFWLSTLLFACPVPGSWQPKLLKSVEIESAAPLSLDLIPIRTPIRTTSTLLTINHTGPDEYAGFRDRLFPLERAFGHQQYLPRVEDAGRWANLPICPRRPSEQFVMPRETKTEAGHPQSDPTPPFQFVACTWTAASYSRRGDVVRVSDSAARLREWIMFHLMVGVQHIYIYDNTDMSNRTVQVSEMWQVAQEFSSEQVSYHVWPCKICNNNRPAHSNPGERSSQYAAEASCRERYGPLTEWMTFLDVDEYLVPMKATHEGEHDWGPILDEFKAKGVPILQFLSSRARPRVELMEEVRDQSVCKDPTVQKNEKFPNLVPCIEPKRDETFLNVYNCEYIRPPKPARFARARKQIYRSSFVWQHFIHYSTVTAAYAETYAEFQRNPNSRGKYLSHAHGATWEKRHSDIFVDELTTGVLLHARSVMPHETRRRSSECVVNSKVACMLGYLCEDKVEFVDDKHQQNVFTNSDGSYCNCWENPVLAENLGPRLKRALEVHQPGKRVSVGIGAS